MNEIQPLYLNGGSFFLALFLSLSALLLKQNILALLFLNYWRSCFYTLVSALGPRPQKIEASTLPLRLRRVGLIIKEYILLDLQVKWISI